MLTAADLLNAYAHGIFPMAETAQSTELYWVDPLERCLLPLDTFHVPRRLLRTVKNNEFTITINKSFRDVMQACAQSTVTREKTWINTEIIKLYCELHAHGHAHSVEAWKNEKLVGGLYGVSLGTAFFGESMFTRARDASKVALCHLVARLKQKGFTLLDAQFENPHLNQFGAQIVSRADYQRLLGLALESLAGSLAGASPSFAEGAVLDGGGATGFLQSSAHTS